MTDESYTICSPVASDAGAPQTTTVYLAGEFDMAANDDLRTVICDAINARSSNQISSIRAMSPSSTAQPSVYCSTASPPP